MIYSDTGLEHINKAGDNTMFVLENFDGDIYQRLNRESCRIFAPPVIIQCANEGKVGDVETDNILRIEIR